LLKLGDRNGEVAQHVQFRSVITMFPNDRFPEAVTQNRDRRYPRCSAP
jgi:hypothetical protein